MKRLKESIEYHKSKKAKKNRREKANRYTVDPELRVKLFERGRSDRPKGSTRL